MASVPSGTAYNPSGAEACVSEVSTVYANSQMTLGQTQAIDAACIGVFDGPGGMGASCHVDSECKTSTGLRCVPAAGTARGTCQLPQVVQGGGSCSASYAQCVTGYHCGISAHCDIDAMKDMACDNAQNPCGPGLLCSGASMTCQDKAMDGTACASNDDCLHGICNRAMGSSMGVCVSQVNLAPAEPFCVDSR